MSKRRIAYARKNVIDPEEEGEELPFEPRPITIHTDYWFDRDYELCDELLGRGKFGEVKKCYEKASGRALAAKIVTARKQKEKEDVRKEIKIMSQLRHPKILQIYDAFESTRRMCIITELVEGGELFDRIVDETFDLTERVAILFMRQIIDGIAFIHSQNILHLDMKPENVICVAKKGTRIKIIDFGLAMRYDSFSSTKVMAGTVDFMAPEVCNYEEVEPTTDMWSIGVICYVLVSGLSPFCGDDDADTICNILRVDFDFAAEEFDEITAGCKDFIKKLLIKDPRKRMSAAECMKHSWLNKITRSQTNKHLSKKHHIKFFVKRKWKKIIKAVIALNRFSRLARERREASVTRTCPSEQAAEEPGEIPAWRVRMEERIRCGKAKAEAVDHKKLSDVSLSKTLKNSDLVTSGLVTSSLSCSSGYESSGSTKSTATMDDVPSLVSGDELEPTLRQTDEIVLFQRLESVETLVNDESPVTEKADISDVHITMSSSDDNLNTPVQNDIKLKKDIFDNKVAKETNDLVSTIEKENTNSVPLSQQDIWDRISDTSSEADEVYTFSDSEDTDVSDIDTQRSHTADSLDDLVNKITSRESSKSGPDVSQIQGGSKLTEVKDLPQPIETNCRVNRDSDIARYRYKPDAEQSSLAEMRKGSLQDLRLSRRRSSLLDNIDEKFDKNSAERPRYRRSSGVESGDIRELPNRCSSLGPNEINRHVPRSEMPRYDRSRKSSNVDSESPRGSNHSIRSARRGPSPANRYARSSRHNSREPSIDQDSDDITPIGRRHYWSPSPVRDLNSEVQRKMRIAAICGEDYSSSVSDNDPTERIIPIDIEHSPPPATHNFRSLPRKFSASGIHSDSFAGTCTLPYNDYDSYSIPSRVKRSSLSESESFTSRADDSSTRRCADPRQARIAAILAGSTESLDSFGRSKPPPASLPTHHSFSGLSAENRQARIAAVIGNSSNSTKSNFSAGSRPSSRTNSDDARHRRIAAILAKSDDS